jgi:hypothetical protein
MQASQVQPSHYPLSDLFRLTLQIETVLKTYLRKRFGVTPPEFEHQSIEAIIEALDTDPNVFKNKGLSAPSTEAENEPTYQYVWRTLLVGVSAVSDSVRYRTGKDGRSRLDSLRWISWSLRNFQNLHLEFPRLSDAEQAETFREKLCGEIKLFFAEIQIMLDTPPSDQSKRILHRDNKQFSIFGLKDDPSQLAELLSENLLHEFNVDKMIALINQDIVNQCSRLTNVKIYRQQEKKKQDEVLALKTDNAEMLRKLEDSGNAVRQLQSALQAVEHQSQLFVHELRIKKIQEGTFERRIEKLIQQKNELEHMRRSSQKADLNQREIEANQQELEALLLEKEVFQEETAQLQLQASNAVVQQAALQQELTKIHGQNIDIAKQLDQPAEVLDVVDVEEAQDEDEDSFDVDRFTAALAAHSVANRPLTTVESVPTDPYIESVIKKLDKYKYTAAAQGITLAQLLVTMKKSDYLRVALELDPDLVDQIYKGGDIVNGSGLKSLVELILFELPYFTLPKTKKILLETVFEFSPALRRNPIQDAIFSRYQQERCSDSVIDVYCQYVVAYNTCSFDARKEFSSLMQMIREYCEQLQATPFKSLINELDIPLTVCHTLEKCYIKGAFSALKPLIEDEIPLANAARYEVVYDLDKRTEANAQYERSHRELPIRVRLINHLNGMNDILKSQFNNVVRSVKPIAKTEDIGFEMSVKQMENLRKLNAKKAVVPEAKPDWIPKDKVTEKDVLAARELVYRVIALIDRFGAVLNAGEFNVYQCKEIIKRIEGEQHLGEDKAVTVGLNVQQFRH